MKVSELKAYMRQCNDDAEVVIECSSGSFKLAYAQFSGSEMLFMLVPQPVDKDKLERGL